MSELNINLWLMLTVAVSAVAFLYSSVGHGGATGYLAVLALLGFTPDSARGTALLANCFVAGVAWWKFGRAGHFDLRVFLPLALASVPCAWVGSRVALPPSTYGVLLGTVLIAAGLFLITRRMATEAASLRAPSFPLALAAGAGLGLVAGLTGIGGGVFLSPLLLFLRWVKPKTSGGIAAAFIVLNSIAGLIGLSARLTDASLPLIALALPATAAALLGTHFGVRRWSDASFGRALAVVLMFAGGKLLWGAFA
jgi:uncharacterized membrane protein YfcA